MNLAAVIILIAIVADVVECTSADDQCEKRNFEIAYPRDRYVVFGIRLDTAIFILPSNVIKEIPNDDALVAGLTKDYDLNRGGYILRNNQVYNEWKHVNAVMLEVHGLLQFIVFWRAYFFETGTVYRTCTRVSYYEAFRFVFTPTKDDFLRSTTSMITLACFSDIPQYFYGMFKATRDSRLFIHIRTTDEQIEFIFGRAGTKIFIEKMRRYELDGYFLQSMIIEAVWNGYSTKLMLRRQESQLTELYCAAELQNQKIKVGILYSREELIEAYDDMGDSAFDCKDQKCREAIRDSGGKEYHDKEVPPVHQKGSIYLGFRRGYIFSYRVVNEKEKFSELLFSLDVGHRGLKGGEIKDGVEDVYLFSVDGKETIVLICGPITYYRIYNTNPGNGIKVIHIQRSQMTVIKELKAKCRKADYDAKNGLLAIFSTNSALNLKLTPNHDGKVTPRSDIKLAKFDNFRGSFEYYDSIESVWPMQLRNRRTLFYNTSSKAIEMTSTIIEKTGDLKKNTQILTNYGNYLNALAYFPEEYIEEEYIDTFRNDTKKFPMMYYGISDCTIFVVMSSEEISKVPSVNTGCDKNYTMRAMLLNSYVTVVRTKDFENVQGMRIKVSINFQNVEDAIKKGETIRYTHDMKDAEFESSNSFVIAPGTFNTIHSDDQYTYYQEKPHDYCTYYFKRRRITKSSNKDVQNYTFPALAVSHRRIMSKSCELEIDTVMYDEKLRAFVYVMKAKGQYVLATPNDGASDDFKLTKTEPFYDKYIFSSAFPYLIYKDHYHGPSVLSVKASSNVLTSFKESLADIGFYSGRILYRAMDTKYILGKDIDAIEEVLNDTHAVTKALKREDFEKAAFGDENEIVARPEIHRKKCKLTNAPYFMAFVLKISVLDLLLTLILIIIIVYHRAHIIPARRRFKIKMGILKHRKKRKLRDRARRRLRKLNLLNRRKKKKEQEGEAKRQAALIAAAVGALGVAQGTQQAPAAGAAVAKKSSSSSSEMVTAGGEQGAQSEMINAPGAPTPPNPSPLGGGTETAGIGNAPSLESNP